MATITLTLPGETYRLLEERGRKSGKLPREVLLEVLEEALKKNASDFRGPTRSVGQILAATGRLRALSPYLQDKIIAGVSLKEVKASMQKAGGKPLSIIIMEQRGRQSHA